MKSSKASKRKGNNMIATCPNDPEHKTFLTTAHVMQEWKVDEQGEFIKATRECLEVTAYPDAGNIWVCASCRAEAVVK